MKELNGTTGMFLFCLYPFLKLFYLKFLKPFYLSLTLTPPLPLVNPTTAPSQGYEHKNARPREQHHVDPDQDLKADQRSLRQDGSQDDAQGGDGSPSPHLTM